MVLAPVTKSIGAGAFYNCTKLSSINLQEGMTLINTNVFYGCKALTSIEIPSTVKTLNSYAFSGCIGLKSITLPENLSKINSNALNCKNLKTIYAMRATPPTAATNAFGTSKLSNCIVYVPNNSAVTSYRTTNVWKTMFALANIKVNTSTDILSLDVADEHAETVVYDLNGIRRQNPHKGIFIKNGRKVVVK